MAHHNTDLCFWSQLLTSSSSMPTVGPEAGGIIFSSLWIAPAILNFKQKNKNILFAIQVHFVLFNTKGEYACCTTKTFRLRIVLAVILFCSYKILCSGLSWVGLERINIMKSQRGGGEDSWYPRSLADHGTPECWEITEVPSVSPVQLLMWLLQDV